MTAVEVAAGGAKFDRVGYVKITWWSSMAPTAQRGFCNRGQIAGFPLVGKARKIRAPTMTAFIHRTIVHLDSADPLSSREFQEG